MPSVCKQLRKIPCVRWHEKCRLHSEVHIENQATAPSSSQYYALILPKYIDELLQQILSSCGQYAKYPCVNRCDREHNEYSKYFGNDYAYEVLQKICLKVFKRFNRTRCRELYTVFGGGNSINVRIHRSSSLGQSEAPVSSCSPNSHSQWKHLKFGQNEGKFTKSKIGDGNAEKVSKSNNDLLLKEKLKHANNGRTGRGRRQHYDGEYAETKTKSKKDGGGIKYDDSDKLIGQKKKYAQRKEKQAEKYTHDENIIDKDRNGKRNGYHKKKRDGQKLKREENDIEENQYLPQNATQSKEKKQHKRKGAEFTIDINVQDRRITKNDDTNIARHTQNGDFTKKYGKSLKPSNKHADFIISDLSKKVRQGTLVGFSNESAGPTRSAKPVRATNQEIQFLQRRVQKRTRADEAKPCDLLRAYMEQRDQCQSLYRSQELSSPCTTCTCSKFCFSYQNGVAPWPTIKT